MSKGASLCFESSSMRLNYPTGLPRLNPKTQENKVTFGIREIKHDVIRQTANANNSVYLVETIDIVPRHSKTGKLNIKKHCNF